MRARDIESSVITGDKKNHAQQEKKAQNFSRDEPGEGGTGAATHAASLLLPRTAESTERNTRKKRTLLFPSLC